MTNFDNCTKVISDHYKKCFDTHGDNHLGADWPKQDDLITRYNVMLSVVKNNRADVSLLDFGCGTGMLLEHINRSKITDIKYSGMDINKKTTEVAKTKFKDNEFYCANIFEDNFEKKFDYIVCNGVFTEKLSLEKDEMFNFMCSLIEKLFTLCNDGLAFNVMSTHVDYENPNLFHLEHDKLLNFVTKKITRNYIIRSDYGLYEYTVYLYKVKNL